MAQVVCKTMNFVLKKYFKKKSLCGFSLGEVLLAGFVLTVGLLAISALMTKSLKGSFETRDTIVAVLLAQEGVELVRNVRDNDFVASSGNADGFPASSFDINKKYCRMSYNDSNVDCLGAANEPNSNKSRYYLEYTPGNKMYKHTGNQGRFSRYIYIDYDDSAKEATVKSFVYWSGGNAPSGIESGNIANCNIAKKCVYTEVFLNSWYTAP